MEGSSGIGCKVSGQNGVTYARLDETYSESLGGSTQIPKTENWFGVEGSEFVAVYGNRSGRGVTPSTTFVQLRACMSLGRDPGMSLA